LLMPSHAKMVQPYRDRVPMFAKFGVETQLDAMFSNHVTLKSGGYIVINQAEALVAIDVNSGKSTREHNIEDTALRTNLEAAEEISRQLRLRDLAGLIVIDFIDMEEGRNNRTVERRLKDSLKNDRARIQIGRMSHFGLLEMSRQRLRAGVIEGSTIACPVCGGAGTVRSTASIALHVLRALEDALIKNSDYDLLVKARMPVALYILNQKRSHLRDLETRFGVSVTIAADDGLATTSFFTLHRGEVAAGTKEPLAAAPIEAIGQTLPEDLAPTPGESPPVVAPSDDEAQVASEEPREAENEAYSRQRRRRRRRRGRGSEREASGISANAPQPPDDALEAMAKLAELGPAASSVTMAGTDPAPPLATEDNRRSARGHLRGGRYAPQLASTEDAVAGDEPAGPEAEPNEPDLTEGVPLGENVAAGEKKHRRGRRTPRARRVVGSKARGTPLAGQDFTDPFVSEEPAPAEQTHSPPAGADSDQPNAHGRGDAKTLSGTEEAVEEGSRPGADLVPPKRTGWWQRAREGSRG
jgi:ribonuclease E